MNKKKHGWMQADIQIVMGGNSMESYQAKELVDKVRKIINDVTESKYISNIDIKKEDDFYRLQFDLGCRQAPFALGFTGSEEELLEFIKKEFKKRRLESIEYTTVTLENGPSTIFYPVIDL